MRSGVHEAVVVGAGQAGLSASHHLRRLGVDHVVLDANPTPGGAWQHRAHSLIMTDVHEVAALPDAPLTEVDPAAPAREVVAAYFADYEVAHRLPVVRPVEVGAVRDDGGLLVLEATDGRRWRTRSVVNASGTWRRPFVPHVPGIEAFAGEQLHSAAYDGPEPFAGRTVLVVGGGHSAVQVLGEIAPAARTLWATRREPLWRDSATEPFDGRAAVALVEERVRRGLPPASVVSVTGLQLRPQEREAARLGAYARLPMPTRFDRGGATWPDGTHRAFDVVLWATGFRLDVAHLAPLHLRGRGGGIELHGTTAAADPRVQLVGYGPSASTIGANRAGRAAAVAVRDLLRGAAV